MLFDLVQCFRLSRSFRILNLIIQSIPDPDPGAITKSVRLEKLILNAFGGALLQELRISFANLTEIKVIFHRLDCMTDFMRVSMWNLETPNL